MLKAWQVAALTALAAALWVLVTVGLRVHPATPGGVSLALRLLIGGAIGGVFSVWLCKVVGRLSPEQILPGTALVGAVAMSLDGLALRWLPGLYGGGDAALRLGAGDLLWGYGAGLAAALIWRWAALARQPTAA